MKSCKVNAGLLGLLLMGVMHQANAEIYEFTNGDDGTVMATLELTATGTANDYLFDLAFVSNAGRGNFSNLDFLAIKTTTADPSTTLVSYTDIATADTPVVVTQDGTATGNILGLSFDYDHAFDFADNTNTSGMNVANHTNSIVVGESVSWVASYSEPLIVESAVVVFRNDGGNNPNFFDNNVTAAVPEPETYAMFLAGIGLLGFAARRNA